MDKKLIVGGLAVVGGLALVVYLIKPKSPRKNSEGFFNAGGKTAKYGGGWCKRFDPSRGNIYMHDNGNGGCPKGETHVAGFGL